MRRTSFLVLSLGLLCSVPLAAQEEETSAALSEKAADSHAEIADALVALLRRTVTTLEQCTDAATTASSLAQLQAQREEAAQLIARQALLPEPTVQDYMAAQARANDFLDAKRALQTHIARLQTEGLMTAEIRKILGIAPESPTSAK